MLGVNTLLTSISVKEKLTELRDDLPPEYFQFEMRQMQPNLAYPSTESVRKFNAKNFHRGAVFQQEVARVMWKRFQTALFPGLDHIKVRTLQNLYRVD